MRRGPGGAGPVDPGTGRLIERERELQARYDSDIDRLAVLCALHVPDAGLVPRGGELRESDCSDQRDCEQSSRHDAPEGHEGPLLVHMCEHSVSNCEIRFDREQGNCSDYRCLNEDMGSVSATSLSPRWITWCDLDLERTVGQAIGAWPVDRRSHPRLVHRGRLASAHLGRQGTRALPCASG